MGESILINGINYSWNNVQVILYGIPLVGVTSISYSKKVNKKFNHGAGPDPVSFGVGNNEYSGSITLSTDEVRQINKASSGGSFTNNPLSTLIVLYSGDGVNFAKDVVSNVAFMEDSFKADQGNTGMWQTLPFIFAGLKKTTS